MEVVNKPKVSLRVNEDAYILFEVVVPCFSLVIVVLPPALVFSTVSPSITWSDDALGITYVFIGIWDLAIGETVVVACFVPAAVGVVRSVVDNEHLVNVPSWIVTPRTLALVVVKRNSISNGG